MNNIYFFNQCVYSGPVNTCRICKTILQGVEFKRHLIKAGKNKCELDLKKFYINLSDSIKVSDSKVKNLKPKKKVANCGT